MRCRVGSSCVASIILVAEKQPPPFCASSARGDCRKLRDDAARFTYINERLNMTDVKVVIEKEPAVVIEKETVVVVKEKPVVIIEKEKPTVVITEEE